MTWTPVLELSEAGGRCRLALRGLARGEGETLQEAADDLITRPLAVALLLRRSGIRTPGALGPPDLQQLSFVYELGEIAARGGDIRERVFGFD